MIMLGLTEKQVLEEISPAMIQRLSFIKDLEGQLMDRDQKGAPPAETVNMGRLPDNIAPATAPKMKPKMNVTVTR